MKDTFDLNRFLISKPWLVHLLLVFLVALSTTPYVLANWAHFNYDDYALIIENPTIRDFKNLPTVLASGRPVRGITFMIDYALFGLDPRGYHLDNWFWHIMATVLFYLLVFRIFGNMRLAAAAAVLFGFHPVHAEAVMAIAHRKEMLAMTFMMLSYHAFLYRERYPASSVVLCVLFFVLGLLSKQVVIVLPLIFYAHEWLSGSSLFERKTILRILPLLAIGAVLILGGLLFWAPIFRDFNLFGRFSVFEIKEMGYSSALATSFSVYPLHLRHIIFPVHLNVDPWTEIVTWSHFGPWLGAGLFLGLFLAAIRFRKDLLVGFCLLWIFINLLPIMNWIPQNAFFAERYLYIPSAGFCLLAAGLWERLYHSRHRLWSENGYRAIMSIVTFVFLVLVITAPTAIRINYWWPRREMYYVDRAWALFISGSVFALIGTMVFALVNRGRAGKVLEKRSWLEGLVVYLIVSMLLLGSAGLVEAQVRHRFGLPRKDIEKSFVFARDWLSRHAKPGPRPDHSIFLPTGTRAAELGNILFFTFGGSSLWVFLMFRLRRRGRRGHPNQELSWAIIGLVVFAFQTQVVMRAGTWTSEVVLWKSTVMEEPRSLRGWNNLGKAYVDRRRFDLAVDALRRAIALNPGQPETHRNLGMAYLGAKDLKGAKNAFERALHLSPGDLTSRLNFANILVHLAQQGIDKSGYQKAIGHYLRILEADPRSAHAHHNLAVCYFQFGNLKAAAREVGKALYINPQDQNARVLLKRIREAGG